MAQGRKALSDTRVPKDRDETHIVPLGWPVKVHRPVLFGHSSGPGATRRAS